LEKSALVEPLPEAGICQMNNVMKRCAFVAATVFCCFLAVSFLPSETRAAKTTSITKKVIKTNIRKTRATTSKKRRTGKGKSAYVGRKVRRITLNAPWKCVPGRLKSVISQVSRKFGRVVINSTHRSKRKNRMVGGKSKSYHIGCRAVDFRVHGRTRGLTRWLARHPKVGGFKRYRSGFYHIDIGPKRTW
jgi:uncharacterized protein YcbK (DUF882 family)